MIDRIAKELDIELKEVPVGFKWFVSGLLAGSLGFGGEESAGASFLRHDGYVWSTERIAKGAICTQRKKRKEQTNADAARPWASDVGRYQ